MINTFTFTGGKNISEVSDVNTTLHEMTETTNTEFSEIRQMLDFEVTGWLDGKTLSCDVAILSENGILRWESTTETRRKDFFVKGKFSDQIFTKSINHLMFLMPSPSCFLK